MRSPLPLARARVQFLARGPADACAVALESTHGVRGRLGMGHGATPRDETTQSARAHTHTHLLKVCAHTHLQAYAGGSLGGGGLGGSLGGGWPPAELRRRLERALQDPQ